MTHDSLPQYSGNPARPIAPGNRSKSDAGPNISLGADRDAASAGSAQATAIVLESVDAIAAATWLQHESRHPLRVPVGVIGRRDATPAQIAKSYEI